MFDPAVPSYRGGRWRPDTQQCDFNLRFCGHSLHLGSFSAEDAASGARLYDALQLLLRGARADTTYLWSTYTRADIAAAAAFLEAQRIDVPRAVVALTEGTSGASGRWLGVRPQGACWAGDVGHTPSAGGARVALRWGWQPSAEAAARDVDRLVLAVKGLGCTTNFPVATYSQEELEEAGAYAVGKGVDAARVRANLEDVQQAKLGGTLDQFYSLQARAELLASLDLIPAAYTYEACLAAVRAAACDGSSAMAREPGGGKKRAHSALQQDASSGLDSGEGTNKSGAMKQLSVGAAGSDSHSCAGSDDADSWQCRPAAPWRKAAKLDCKAGMQPPGEQEQDQSQQKARMWETKQEGQDASVHGGILVKVEGHPGEAGCSAPLPEPAEVQGQMVAIFKHVLDLHNARLGGIEAQRDEACAQLTEARSQLDAARQEVARLRASLEDAGRQREEACGQRAETLTQLEAARQEVARLQASLVVAGRQREEACGQQAETLAQLAAARQEAERLRASLEDAGRQRQEACGQQAETLTQLEAARREVARLQANVAAARRQREEACSQQAEIQRQLEAARKSVTQLQASMEAGREEMAQLHTASEEAGGQLAAESARTAELQAGHSRSEGTHEQLRKAWEAVVDELKEQLKVARHDAARAESGRKAAEDREGRLRSQGIPHLYGVAREQKRARLTAEEQARSLQRQVAALQQEVSALRSAHPSSRTPNQPRAQVPPPPLQHTQVEAGLLGAPLAAPHTTLLATTAERSLARGSEAALTASQPRSAMTAYQQLSAAALNHPPSAPPAYQPLNAMAAYPPFSAVPFSCPGGGGRMAPSQHWTPPTPNQPCGGMAPTQPLNAALRPQQAWQDITRGSLNPPGHQQHQQRAAPAGALCAGGRRSSAQRVPPLPNSLQYTGGPAAPPLPRAPSGQAAGGQQGPGLGVP